MYVWLYGCMVVWLYGCMVVEYDVRVFTRPCMYDALICFLSCVYEDEIETRGR